MEEELRTGNGCPAMLLAESEGRGKDKDLSSNLSAWQCCRISISELGANWMLCMIGVNKLPGFWNL